MTEPARIAVLSDPHGDLESLQRVLADLEAAGPVDEVLLGGDLAQGGPQPAEVVDEIRRRGWRSVRGNSDDILVDVADGRPPREALPPAVAERAGWSVSALGPERIGYLRSLPLSIELGPYEFGTVMLVHATPWNNEDVILPDADDGLAHRAVAASDARVLLYGHIHTAYQRRVGDSVLMSVGAISGSNDQDPRPAYTILELGSTITAEVRRTSWAPERPPGPLPVRSRPGERVRLWP